MRPLPSVLLFVLACHVQGQFSYHHAFTVGGPGFDSASDIAVDGSGNVYVVGGFSIAFDIDPGPLTTMLTPVGNDAFLAKYSDAGALQWAVQMGGTGFEGGSGIAVSGGTICITGSYTSVDADIDPGPNEVLLPPANGSDIFVARYDLDGNYLFSFAVGGSADDVAVDIEVGGDGMLAICGTFESTDLDADPSGATEILATTGGVDGFVMKFSMAGTLLFAHSFGGAGGTLDSDRPLGLHLATSGDLYVTGSFNSTGGDFDPGPATVTLNSAGSIDIFLLKFNSLGVLGWAHRLGGTGGDLGYEVTTDHDGNLYLCGYANSNVIDLDPGPDEENFSSGEGQDIVLVKLDPAGTYQWGLRIGGGSSDIAFAAAIDEADHLLLAGNFGDADVDFDPGPGAALLSSSSVFETDIFLAQFDLSGNFVDAVDVGGSGTDVIRNLALAANGRLWAVGSKLGTVDADPGPGTELLDSLGSQDVFVGSYDHVHAVGIAEGQEPSFQLQPNPARERVTVGGQVSGPARIELLDAAGRVLLVQQVPSFPVDLDLRKVPPGIHTVQVHAGARHFTRKLLKVP